MSVVCIDSKKVSETRRSFKQTCFCDKGPEFSNEANPHLVFYWIRRGYISSHLGAMNLNTCFKRNEKKNRKDTLTPNMHFTARFSCCATIDFNSTSKYFPSGYDNKLYITVFGICRTICRFWTDKLCNLYLLQVSASS